MENKKLSLNEFLAQNNPNKITKEIYISERLSQFSFKIKPLSRKKHSEYMKRFGKTDKFGNTNIDSELLQNAVIKYCTLEPNFESVEFIQLINENLEEGKPKISLPDEAIDEVLLSGETTKLFQEISKLSGFNINPNEKLEEAKN